MQTSHERRRHERFIPINSAFIFFRPEFSKIGLIEDIGRGGLRCRYFLPFDEKSPDFNTSHKIDIFISKFRIHLTDIPCNLVYDFTTPSNQVSFMPDLRTRQWGLKFDSLTEEQAAQINDLLEKHTAGNA